MRRGGFLAALAALPFVGKLVPAAPQRFVGYPLAPRLAALTCTRSWFVPTKPWTPGMLVLPANLAQTAEEIVGAALQPYGFDDEMKANVSRWSIVVDDEGADIRTQEDLDAVLHGRTMDERGLMVYMG